MKQIYDHPSAKSATAHLSTHYEKWNGIHISSETRKHFADFEAQYAHLRAQEHRVFSTEEIKRLPDTGIDHPHYQEWEMRKHTVSAFMEYLKTKGKGFQVLDLGCGNGFFSHLIANEDNRVIGVDISLFELEQAVNAFGFHNPSWYYADIMRDRLPVPAFDIIVLSAVLAYFPDPRTILHQCMGLLKPGGEIHILESPVYENEKAVAKARENSARHFQSKGAPGMMLFYHFHTWEVLNDFHYSVNSRFTAFVNKVLGLKRSPFPWITIKKS